MVAPRYSNTNLLYHSKSKLRIDLRKISCLKDKTSGLSRRSWFSHQQDGQKFFVS